MQEERSGVIVSVFGARKRSVMVLSDMDEILSTGLL